MSPHNAQATRVEKIAADELWESVNFLDPVHARIEVQVAADTVERERARQSEALAKEARIPGFRPGRVPRVIVERYLGTLIKEAVQRELVAEALAQVVRAHRLRVVGTLELQDVSLSWGHPLEFKVVVEVLPHIPDVRFENLEVEVPRVVVSDKDVDQALIALQERYATLMPVEDRELVEVGDVVAAITRRLDATSDNPEAKEQLLWVREESESTSVVARLVGRRIGETVVVGDDQSPQGGASVERSSSAYAVRIEKIYRRCIPPLDEEFAKTVGSVDTLAELRAQVAKELEARGKLRQETVLRQKLRKALVDANKEVPAPPTLLAREREHLTRSYVAALGWPEAAAQEFMRQNPELAARLEEEARLRVSADLLLAAIAEKEEMVVSEEEVEGAVERLAARRGYSLDALRTAYRDADARAQLRQELLLERALEKVRMTAQVREVTVDEESLIAAPPGNG